MEWYHFLAHLTYPFKRQKSLHFHIFAGVVDCAICGWTWNKYGKDQLLF